MKNYEITYLIPSTLTEEEQKGITEEISSLIQEKGGALKEGGTPIRRILPEQIGQHKEIFSVSVGFYAQPEKIQEIQDVIKQNKSILRFIVLVKKAPSAVKPIRRRSKEEPTKKAELKDIEKKIDEILK